MGKEKPQLSFWQIWNMCFGFLGIQFGFALQNGNVSRIFQTLGADMDTLPILWIAAPLTGLLVQPIIGHFSDKTWTRLGRRRPYFLYGAIATSLALVVMPNASALWMAAGTLWILDAAINVSMEPFRAFVGDNLPKRQQAQGYSMQSFFIGVGAVVASAMPWLLEKAGVNNTAAAGTLPDTVIYSFYAGAVVLLLAVGWTVFSSKEYSPEQLASFEESHSAEYQLQQRSAPQWQRSGLMWALPGVLATAVVALFALDKELYILTLGLAVFGLLQLWLSRGQRAADGSGVTSVMNDLFSMPTAMKRLAVVQFFSWFALFAMWIYMTPAVTSTHFGSTDPASALYNQGANWVGMLFAGYNGFAAIAALIIPLLVRLLGLRGAHQFNLLLGAAGFMSFLWIDNPDLLMVAMVGVGFAWASILSLPYAMLAGCLPVQKLGVYMGIFNFFIVIPQLVAATVLGLLLRLGFNSEPIYALFIGAVSWVIAAVAVFAVQDDSVAAGHVQGVSQS
ncbi:MFS transporter [uncultured Ferrimonas sp.]|uniref:MFS transporter n=1 Tax=uncultured Ferrimonas sp. TaxID=432640 RepID=UPI0026154301|nr:MFS transporter [uncultured Ferrimonas sp.]